MNLTEILNRRNDLSTFLVHLTREFEGVAPKTNLESILRARCIEARSIYGHLRTKLAQQRREIASQRTVCFTETPLEFTYLLIENIENRLFRFAPYGVAITKRIGRRTGVNPIWYVDITPGHNWLTNQLDVLADRFLADEAAYADLERMFPFIDHMGTGEGAEGGGYRKEFWWEREWRHVGNYRLPETLICLCPVEEIDHFQRLMREAGLGGACIDPRWSLEKIVARLAGFANQEIDVM
jgi:hypothetical protein